MIYVDPAHPAFQNLPKQHRAAIYRSRGWGARAIAEELGAHWTTVRYWTDPEWRARKQADALRRHHARKGTAA